MIALGLALALAANGEGLLVLETTPQAQLVVFPRVEPGRIDLGIYGNRVPLSNQLDGVSTRYLRQGWATSIGGGTWFVTLQVDDEQVGVRWKQDEGRIVLRLAPGEAELEVPPPPPTLAQLLDDPPPRRPAAPPPLTLHPLRGDASTLTMSASDAFVGMPVVRTSQVATYKPSLAAIDTYREVWISSDDPDVRAAAMVRAGTAYQALGLHRDALYYFLEALDLGRNDPASVLAVARSHAAMGQQDALRSSCRYAARRGADDEDVLACLGAAALLEGSPSPTHVGRALAEITDDPHRRLLAAQLLQVDHRHSEALPILRRLVETEEPAVMASLGDALQATGDLAGAVDAWRAGARSRGLQPRMTLRMRMAEMLVEGPSALPQAVPLLLAEAERGGLVGAEAHYLIAQIAQIHADPELVAEQLNQLWDEQPDLAVRGDVPEQLIATCDLRVRGLDERPVEQIAFFQSCWRRQLDELVSDPQSIERASRAHAALGLVDDALTLHSRTMAVHARSGHDDPQSLAWLAELHLRTGRRKEALDTIRYVRGLPNPSVDVLDQLFLTEGKALQAENKPEAALAAWDKVKGAARPEAGALRSVALGHLGRCEEAGAELPDDVEGSLLRARCLLRSGRAADAAALLAQAGLDGETVRDDAAWLEGVASFEGAAVEATGIWSNVLEEERATTELLDALNRR